MLSALNLFKCATENNARTAKRQEIARIVVCGRVAPTGELPLMKEMLRSRQPTILSGMALFGLIVGVEVFVMIFGVVGDRNTLFYTVPFLGVPAFWGWLLFLSYAPMRRAAPSKRLFQVIASACVLGGLLCLLQWGAVLAMSDVITEISDTSSYTFLLSLVIGYTLSEATVLGAIPEEVFKFCLLYLIASREPLPSRYGTVMYAISASLGFVIVSGTWRLLRVFASTEKSEVQLLTLRWRRY